jgi:hypothetical protein
VKEQRLVIDDQVLVERECSRAAFDGDRRVDAVNSIGDLMDVGSRVSVS